MDKATLTRRIQTANGGKILISQNKAMQILGMGKAAFRETMQGYDYKVGGRGNAKTYLVDDVAEAVLKK